MGQITIIDQGPLTDKDGYWATCTYDDSGQLIKVTITDQVFGYFQDRNVPLEEIFELAVLYGLQHGQREGEVFVSAENPAEQLVTVKWKTFQENHTANTGRALRLVD
jgi:hypothetical protein